MNNYLYGISNVPHVAEIKKPLRARKIIYIIKNECPMKKVI